MGKHGRGRGRKFRKYIPGIVDESLALGTLATKTLVLTPFDNVVDEECYITSVDASWALNNWTPIADVGPIMVGLSHSDYSAAEVEAVIEATGSWSRGDLIAQEVANRKVKIVGIFDEPEDATKSVHLNEGRKIHTKLGWNLVTGQTVELWAYNLGAANIATTIPNIFVQGKAHLWPR